MILMSLFMFLARGLEPYQNNQIQPHTVDGTEVRYAKDAQEESQLWQNEVLAFQKKYPQSKLLLQPPSEGMTSALSLIQKPGLPLFVISSGIHGAEAFTGTALQRHFLKELMMRPDLKVNLLLIHSINSYGFKKFRRTNANNVDLNRNFFNLQNPLPQNRAYQSMQELFRSQRKVSTSVWAQGLFYLRVGWFYLWQGKKEILGILSGQDHDAQGLYFSGATNQDETLLVQKWMAEQSKDASLILHIDLHTGFGERGRLHFYGSDEFNSREQTTLLQKVFPNIPIDTGHSKDFYVTHGDFVDWSWKNLPDKKVIPMVFEFGTMDSQTLAGGLKSLWITMIENQGANYGYQTVSDQLKTRQLFEELFNPQDYQWQQKVLEQGSRELQKSLEHLSNFPST